MREPRATCPRCGARLRHKRDGVFTWRYCPRTKACGWTVFTHGADPRDHADDARRAAAGDPVS